MLFIKYANIAETWQLDLICNIFVGKVKNLI